MSDFSTMMFLAKVSTDLSAFFHLYPERYIPFTSPHFFPIFFVTEFVLKVDILVVLDRAKCGLEHGI